MSPESIRLIVRVLCNDATVAFDQGSEDIQPHREKIAARYRELKQRHDFQTSAVMARTEWLAEYLNANR